MKILDEVITVMDHVEFCCTNCKLQFDCDETECILEDALHYLKAFLDAKNALDAERERTIEAYCQWKDARKKLEAQTSQMMWVDKHFQFEISDNSPLGWETLKQMEGKPVWVENQFYKRWLIAYKVNREDIIFDENGFYTQAFSVDYGKSWQAYRKERE